MSKQTNLRSLFEARDHPPDKAVSFSRLENFEAVFLGTPFDDVDVDMPDAPRAHGAPAGLVKVDCVGAGEGAAIVVDHVTVAGFNDLKARPQREPGPVRRGAHDIRAGEARADVIVAPAALRVGVGGGANVRNPPRAGDGGRPHLRALRGSGRRRFTTGRGARQSAEHDDFMQGLHWGRKAAQYRLMPERA